MHVADALCEALADDDGDIRWAAANLIVRLGREYPAEIRERLLALGADSDRNVRKMALYCLLRRTDASDERVEDFIIERFSGRR